MQKPYRLRPWSRILLLMVMAVHGFGGPVGSSFQLFHTKLNPSIQPPVEDLNQEIQNLVEVIFGQDEQAAQEAVTEVLRLAGLPVVSVDGPVIAQPPGMVLEDAAVYAELIPDLTRSLRRRDFYQPEQIAILLVEAGVTPEPLALTALVAGLGQWGKGADDPAESQVAGAAVRALAGRRLQVLYQGADLEGIDFDLLQATLILAHATSRARPALAEQGNGFIPVGWGVQSAWAQDKGPCDDLEKTLTPPNQVQEVMKDQIKGKLIDAWKEFLFSEQARQAIGKGENVYSKGTAILNVLLLLLGAQIEVSDNQGGITHFKHEAGSRAEHVKVAALAYFDSNIAKKKVACYKLAGIDVPPPGPMEGFKIRWSLDQRLGRGYEGKYLAVVPADNKKLDSCGTCGDTTGKDGRSTIELYPPVEKNPDVGEELNGRVLVEASLDKTDFPFKLGDLLALRNPAEFAASKLWDLAISALSKAGLPSARRSIRVDYHGADIFVAKGHANLFLFYAVAPVELDLYTCEGLNGQWQGRGGLGGNDTTFFGEIAEGITGQDIPEGVEYLQDFRFMINPEADESVFDIVPEIQMTGVLRINQALMRANKVKVVGQRVARPVGEVEVLLGGQSLSMITFGGGSVYPVYWMPTDERCPEGGYEFESNP